MSVSDSHLAAHRAETRRLVQAAIARALPRQAAVARRRIALRLGLRLAGAASLSAVAGGALLMVLMFGGPAEMLADQLMALEADHADRPAAQFAWTQGPIALRLDLNLTGNLDTE